MGFGATFLELFGQLALPTVLYSVKHSIYSIDRQLYDFRQMSPGSDWAYIKQLGVK